MNFLKAKKFQINITIVAANLAAKSGTVKLNNKLKIILFIIELTVSRIKYLIVLSKILFFPNWKVKKLVSKKFITAAIEIDSICEIEGDKFKKRLKIK